MTDNDPNNRLDEQLPPERSPTDADAARPEGEAREISGVMSDMAGRLSTDEDEQAHILNAMQRRFERIAERTEDAKRKKPGEHSEVFARVEAAIANLSQNEAGTDQPAGSSLRRAPITADAETPGAPEAPPAPAASKAEPQGWTDDTAEALTRHYEAEGFAPGTDRPAPAPEAIEVAQAGSPAAETVEGREPPVRRAAAALAALAGAAGEEIPAPAAADDDQVEADSAPSEIVYVAGARAEPGNDWFAERFEELTARLDALTGGNVTDASLAGLLERLTGLEARIDAALAGTAGGSGGSLQDIEMCIAELATQLETTNAEVARISEIEQQITEFTQRVGGDGLTPGAALLDPASIADLVAERMSSRPMALAAGEMGHGEAGAAGIGELTVMMKDFMSERRTEGEHANAVLDTMQQTIIRLLDRMDALENAQRLAAAPGAAWAAAPAYAPAPEAQPVAEAAAPVQSAPVQPAPVQSAPEAPPAGSLADDDDLFDDELTAIPFGRRGQAAPDPSSGADAVEAVTEADDPSIARLRKVVDELDDETPAESAAIAPPLQLDRRPGANRAAPPVADEPARRPRRKTRRPADPAADRSRFVNAARAAAANANQRLKDAAAPEGLSPAGDDDDLVLEAAGQGPAPKAGRKPSAKRSAKAPAKSSTRTRLLVAALALLVVGLGATKLVTGMKINIPGLSLSATTQQDPATPGASGVAAAPAAETVPGQPVAAPSSDDAAATATPEAPAGSEEIAAGLVQPAAIAPDAEATAASADDGPIGGVSRKQLPSAMVGPLSLRLAAANGDASAQFEVAARFAEGRGVSQDFGEAVKWYQRSAASGFALSQYRLGTLYERGLGVTKDVQRARVWYERAAAKGNIKAMHNLAVLAAGNAAGKPDYTKAARWFTAAAEHGLGDSQFNLAILYQHGLGVPQNEAQAYHWFSLAAFSGDEEAGKRKTSVASAIGTAKAAELDRQVADWRRRPVDKVANDPHVAGQQWQRSG